TDQRSRCIARAAMTRKTFFFKWLLAVISGLLSFVAIELIFRAMLFSDIPYMQQYRDPALYAYMESDNYWKLALLFGKYKPPQTPPPELGWVRRLIDWQTYVHVESVKAADKRPVLLYGDSFVACAEQLPKEECFQGMLNGDPHFSHKHYLLNYGV